MSLYIVRHGRTTANASGLLLGRADPELDEIGQQQAADIAAALPDEVIIYSSPLQRTRQTAAAIGADMTIDDRVIELDYGEFDLQPLGDVPAETWSAWRSDPDFAPPGGESLRQLGTRVGEFLDEIGSQSRDADVVVVTHVSPIKAAMAWALGVGPEISWRAMVGQASITKIVVGDRGPSLHGFNDVSHLRT